MSEPQASPAAGLLARKGLATPAGAVSDPALILAAVSDSESLPGEGAAAPTGKPKPASQLTPDILVRRQGARYFAQRPPDQPEAVVDPVPAVAADVERPEQAVPKNSDKLEIPRPDPALRIDAGVNSVARAEPRRFPALAAGLALALVLGAAGYGYKSGWFDSEPQAPASASGAPVPIEPAQIQSEAARSDSAPSAPESDPSIEVVQPSVDVVSIEPGGAAVIAGRAPPGIELIVLDNGAPIGTTQVNSYGEWVFIPIDPLPSGAHDFGLVIKKIEGGVSVPSLEKMPAAKESAAPGVRGSNEPGTVAGAAAAVSIPPRKPNIGITYVPQPFAVQLASVKTRAGAEREWRVLRDRYPEILAGQSRSFDEAKLAGGVSVVRLRTGGFENRAEAATLCARLVAKHQNCLVVRTSANR